MEITEINGSCGISEIYAFRDRTPTQIIENLINHIYHAQEYKPLYIFSDITPTSPGVRLAQYITLYKLGKLKESKKILNPNSDNYIKIWTWETPSIRKLNGWYGKNISTSILKDMKRDYGNPLKS